MATVHGLRSMPTPIRHLNQAKKDANLRPDRQPELRTEPGWIMPATDPRHHNGWGESHQRSRICCQHGQEHRLQMRAWTSGSWRVSLEQADSPWRGKRAPSGDRGGQSTAEATNPSNTVAQNRSFQTGRQESGCQILIPTHSG